MTTATATHKNEFATKGDLQDLRIDVTASVDLLRVDMNAGFERSDRRMTKMFEDMKDFMIQSFELVYVRFEKIDTRIDLLESGLNVRFDSVNTRLDNVILDMPKTNKKKKFVSPR